MLAVAEVLKAGDAGWVSTCLPDVSSVVNHRLIERLQILVIEDDEMSRDIMTRWLQRRGHVNVKALSDGSAGLAACFQRLPDLLILDQRVPGLSGLAIAEHLRSNFPRKRRPWTVLFTAGCNTSVGRLMATGNFDDLLRKPCVNEDYVAMLTRAHAGLSERRPLPSDHQLPFCGTPPSGAGRSSERSAAR